MEKIILQNTTKKTKGVRPNILDGTFKITGKRTAVFNYLLNNGVLCDDILYTKGFELSSDSVDFFNGHTSVINERHKSGPFDVRAKYFSELLFLLSIHGYPLSAVRCASWASTLMPGPIEVDTLIERR